MIVLKVELHSAVTGQVSEIGRLTITNDGSGDRKRGNYSVALMRRGTTDRVLKRAEVKNHARLSYSVWVLVAKALGALGFRLNAPMGGTVDVEREAENAPAAAAAPEGASPWERGES